MRVKVGKMTLLEGWYTLESEWPEELLRFSGQEGKG
jgi:hypothetical protein